MNSPFDETLIQRAAASVDRATGLALQADAASAAKELADIRLASQPHDCSLCGGVVGDTQAIRDAANAC